MTFRHILEHPVWNVLTSISTFLAVLISLWLANRKKKLVRKLKISQQFCISYTNSEIKSIVTIENIGNVPIILNNFGRCGKERNTIMKDIQKFYDGEDEILFISPNEAKLISYSYKFNARFQEGDAKIQLTSQYNLLNSFIFKAQDTLGNYYIRQ